jgi:hypothetical protein
LAKQLGIAAPSVWPAIAKESKPTTRMPLRFSAEWGYTREAAIRPSNTRVLGERSTRAIESGFWPSALAGHGSESRNI